MATVTDMFVDIDLRYRNTFSIAQKMVWMTEEQNDLFEIFEIDLAPISFPLQTDIQFYPIPAEVDVDRIKTVTIQVNDDEDNPEFAELPFKRNDDRQFVGYSGLYYSLVGDSIFIPRGAVDDRQVYIYLDMPPVALSADQEPSVPSRYQEVLKLGTLERIAAARKDILMKNNYAADKEQKIIDLEWKMKMQTPEFDQPIDMMPRQHRYRRGRYSCYRGE